MKLRNLVLVVLLVGGFWFVISHLPQGALGRLPFVGSPHATEPLQLVEAATTPVCDTKEQNGINIYKKVLPSVVNITSTTLVFDFFYGVVPQQGQGSGFILDKAGHQLPRHPGRQPRHPGHAQQQGPLRGHRSQRRQDPRPRPPQDRCSPP
jgi:hypothetical protein